LARLSSEQQLAKVEKARATREARHTMGRRQREAIRPETPGVAEAPASVKPDPVTAAGNGSHPTTT
jgi:hypothetical protein